MAEEQKNDAEVKPAKKPATRKRAPKTPAPAAGEAAAATPAPAAEAPAKKKPTPRKKAEKKPAAPAPEASPAPAPRQEQPKQEKHEHQAKQEKRDDRRPRHDKGETKPAEQANTNAKPLNTSEERADSTSEERPLVRNIEQSSPKPTSVPGFATPETVGGESGNGGNGRRKRRRNRNRRGGEDRQPQQGGNAPRVDADELYRRAWKIFLGEVTEEGLALMDDRTAQEASRRAFRVAELFLQEAARHKPAADAAPEEPESADEDDNAES